MAPRITIIGGGSYQWVPKLLVDLANTPSLHEAELVLEDLDPEPLPAILQLVDHVAQVRGIGLTATTTTDQREALTGADYVVVTISTGGFASMRHDLEIPERYGIRQSVGDTVGPGGINRALRNIPVFLDIVRDMEAVCPNAWLLNLTNPMTTICRAVTRESPITTVGLCHEVTIMQFTMSLLLDVPFFAIAPTVAGVNHLPLVTALDVDGKDGLALLADVVEHAEERAGEPLAMAFPEGLGHENVSEGHVWTKGDLLAANRVKLELLDRFGVLPAAGDRHLVEFFPGFLTEESGWGERWGVELTDIANREWWQGRHIADLEAMLASDEVSEMPSGEMVAPIIVCHEEQRAGWFPLNLPNDGQVPDLPDDVVVESMCTVDGDGLRGRDRAPLPPAIAEQLRRVSASQELTVTAALSGDREAVFEAMLADPLAGRIDYDALGAMTDELLDATKQWLPQFACERLQGRAREHELMKRMRRDGARRQAPELEVLSFPSLAELRQRLPRLIAGILVLGLGITLTIQAELGVSPYDVLHQGLAELTGLSFGTVVVLLGLVILVVWIPLGQRFGIGTIINTLTVGFVVDFGLSVVPDPGADALRWAMLLVGIVVTALGMGLYIGAGLGPGPRDGLMTGIAAKGFPLWLVRTVLELTALVIGWLLGGDVGVGTVLFAFGIGPLGHWFLARLHLAVGDVDPEPEATVGE